MKLKIVAIYSVLILIIITIAVFAFYFFSRQKNQEYLQIKQEAKVAQQEEDNSTSVIEKEINLESQLTKVKADLAKTAEDYKSVRQLYKHEDYTQIMLTLSVMEAKLYRGGNVKNEIIRLKNLSLNYPDLMIIVKNFEQISNLSSRKELITESESYIKIAKSELLSHQASKFEKVIAFLSKYFTILRASKEEDKMLIDIGEYLNNDDFISAYEVLKRLDIKSPEVQEFADNLKNTSLLQSGINDIYFIISNKLSEEEKLTK